MANEKLASAESRAQRGVVFSKAAMISLFVIFMSIPILNLLFGMGFIIWFSVNIFARSAQRGKDFLWLSIGSLVCLAGIALPAFVDHNHTSYGTCWFYGFVLNVCVGVIIVGSCLGHPPIAEALIKTLAGKARTGRLDEIKALELLQQIVSL